MASQFWKFDFIALPWLVYWLELFLSFRGLLHCFSDEQLSAGWENVGTADAQSTKDVQVDCSQLPLVTDSAGEQVLRLYWLDAFEDAYKHPGNLDAVFPTEDEVCRILICHNFSWYRYVHPVI